MNREFLELLYEKKRNAQDKVDALSEVKVFDGRDGSCHSEVHRADLEAARFLLDELRHIINSYWANSEGEYVP